MTSLCRRCSRNCSSLPIWLPPARRTSLRTIARTSPRGLQWPSSGTPASFPPTRPFMRPEWPARWVMNLFIKINIEAIFLFFVPFSHFHSKVGTCWELFSLMQWTAILFASIVICFAISVHLDEGRCLSSKIFHFLLSRETLLD